MQGLTNKIRDILKKLNIEEPPVLLEKVAGLFSIKIVPYPHFSNNISGTIIQEGNTVIIGVNERDSINRQRFTIAHELGHYLLNHDYEKDVIIEDFFDKPINKEKEANQFAAEILIPRDFLRKDIDQKKNITIPELAKRYLVSEQVMSIRLLDTGLINKI